jgi:CheY-like chemotaxis protein
MAHILVVDDDPAVLLNTCAYLEDEDFEVTEAKSGEEALAAVAQSAPQIAIIDMRLPDMDGNELILKLHEQTPDTRFIIHTGSSDYIIPPELSELGIDTSQVVQKPVADMNVFIEVITVLLSRGSEG